MTFILVVSIKLSLSIEKKKNSSVKKDIKNYYKSKKKVVKLLNVSKSYSHIVIYKW